MIYSFSKFELLVFPVLEKRLVNCATKCHEIVDDFVDNISGDVSFIISDIISDNNSGNFYDNLSDFILILSIFYPNKIRIKSG